MIRVTNDAPSSNFRPFFAAKMVRIAKIRKQYFGHISMKQGPIEKISNKKMISKKSSTNPESFIQFGRGHCMNLATSHGHNHIDMDLVEFKVRTDKGNKLIRKTSFLQYFSKISRRWTYVCQFMLVILNTCCKLNYIE
jgi:hypothetical protein